MSEGPFLQQYLNFPREVRLAEMCVLDAAICVIQRLSSKSWLVFNHELQRVWFQLPVEYSQ